MLYTLVTTALAAPVGTTHPSLAGNPFEANRAWYVNPANQREIDSSIATASGTTKQTLQKMRALPSAYWIDKKNKIHGNTTDTLEGILADAASRSPKEFIVVILYDLPNRDCHAKASNGEICCTYKTDGTCDYNAAGSCSDGLTEYQKEYVDPFAEVVGKYVQQGVDVAVIIEPDSLPNLATNAGDQHCGNSATRAAYTQGITYAVTTMHQKAPGAYLYVDAAHGGWLGWADNAQKFAQQVNSMNIAPYLRGFASNVANYQALGVPCPADAFVDQQGTPRQLTTWCQSHSSHACCTDPCGLLSQYSNGNNEMNYVQTMNKAIAQKMGNSNFQPKWLIDTGRNGQTDMRSDCSNWCNIRGAGAGYAPTTNVSLPGIVDAYFYLKTPGESDGCTQTLPSGSTCPRFDTMCASSDSIGSAGNEPHAPEAGAWFDYQIKQLADNADLDVPPSPPGPSPGPTPGPTPPPPPPPTPPPTPSSCPGGSLSACIGLCPADKFTQCMNDCIANCPSSTAASPRAAAAAAVAPPTAAAASTAARKVTPFGPCKPHGSPCVAEYECSAEHGLCMPTAAKREASMHHSVFRTAYEHALARATPGKEHK